MIDIHSHIIFDVDDGPSSRSETRNLLEESYIQGVRTMIATSHRRKRMFEAPEDKVRDNFQVVQKIASEIASDLTIHYGAELYYTSDILDKLEQGFFPTLAGTSYVLIEFSMEASYKEIQSGLSAVLRLGLTPVVAHIERYHCLEGKRKKVQTFIDMGCYMQINSSSVLKVKRFGDKERLMKKRAQFFLKHKLVHFVASDVHNTSDRRSYMKEAYHLLCQQYGQSYAHQLLYENQQLLLNDQLI